MWHNVFLHISWQFPSFSSCCCLFFCVQHSREEIERKHNFWIENSQTLSLALLSKLPVRIKKSLQVNIEILFPCQECSCRLSYYVFAHDINKFCFYQFRKHLSSDVVPWSGVDGILIFFYTFPTAILCCGEKKEIKMLFLNKRNRELRILWTEWNNLGNMR